MLKSVINVIGLVLGNRREFNKIQVGILGAFVVVAEFFVREETFLDALEGAEFLVEIGEWFAGAHGFEKAILHEGKEGLEIGFAMGLVLNAEGLGELAEGFGGAGFGMMFGVELAEIARAGGKPKAAFGAGFRKLKSGVLVGQLFAEVEDEGLVFFGKAGEFVEAFHMMSG